MTDSLWFDLAGLAIVAVESVMIWPGWRSTRWPTVEGRIRTSEVQRVAFPKGVEWRPDVRYSYTVDGRGFQGDKVRMDGGPFYGGELEASEACAFRYRPATAVDVYYNPARPDESVLEPGTPLRNWAMLAVGFLLIIAGFAIPG